MAYYPSGQEPHWQYVNYRHRYIHASVKHWLLDKGSLTQKLIELSKGKLRIEVLQQSIQRPKLSEHRALEMNHRAWAMVREVILYGDNEPWVYARTIVPLSTLQGHLRRLHYLGNRPLGSELFKDPSMKRKDLQLAAVKNVHLAKPLQHLNPLWGRRSVFLLQKKPLLVGEFFLNGLINSKSC